MPVGEDVDLAAQAMLWGGLVGAGVDRLLQRLLGGGPDSLQAVFAELVC